MKTIKLLALGPQEVIPPVDGGKEGIHGALASLARRFDVTYAYPRADNSAAAAPGYQAIGVRQLDVPFVPVESPAVVAGATLRGLPYKFEKYSTAEAARMVAGSRFRGAIASQQAAQEHGLEVLAYPINDVPGNCTRFLLLRRGERSLDGPLASLAFSLHANQPGALLQALGCFAQLALNMSRIESRPSKREMGEYIFFVDLELPNGPEPLRQALRELEPLCEHLAVFGAYPLTQLEAL